MRCPPWMLSCARGDATAMRVLHGWLTILWFVAAIPIMVFWSSNIPLLVGISVYAVTVGHWSSWQASRVEEKQDDQIEQAAERDSG